MHTPYDGSSKLFTIGLKPLDLKDWIDADGALLAYLDQKDRLAARVPHDIFGQLPGSEAAQREALMLLADHLPERFPDIYMRMGPQVDVVPAFRRARLDDPLTPPLLIAAGMVQEDLVVLEKREEGWTVTAGALAFPSSWRLSDKLGRPMHEVHGPVPGFNAGTRNAAMIERMFDNLKPELPVMRWNWSLYGDAELHHPEPGNAGRRFGTGEVAENVYLRLERQTLRRLPDSGAILFTIRIYIDPFEALESHADGPEIATALIAQIGALTPEQLDYKGMTADREALIRRLEALAAK
ncbi:heme-dependent oxidative N-demethylase family protein [Asticcacaulis solisilvae]|uniref:heme-dependent oxidative N-demethylase family protein n=1 Tax=Asticcacaulis solisilvae TaxID=1217274 RepID=UPI003FD787A2